MPRPQNKHIYMKNQDNMSPSKTNTLIAILPEKSNLAEAQDKDFKIAIMTVFKVLKEAMNKYLN